MITNIIINNRNRRSFDNNYSKDQVAFSAVGASWDAQSGRLGRIKFENTLANINQGWESRDSVFQCELPGIYFFTMSARGRFNYEFDNSNTRRNRYYPYNDEAADIGACFEWKYDLFHIQPGTKIYT